MRQHRLSPEAQAELDEIWHYLAVHSGSSEIADRVIDSITDSMWLLASLPYLGRRRDHDLRPGLRTFPVGEYVLIYRVAGLDVLILHIVRGSRDIHSLLS